jgi:MYXO-CTERM domain-containing protein
MDGMTKRLFVGFIIALLALVLPRAAFAQERCPDSHSGTITAANPVQTGHLQNGAASACGTSKATPSVQAANVGYDAFTLENRSTTASCVTVNLSASAGSARSTIYKGTYDPANPQTNYLGDSGGNAGGGAPVSYGVTIPPLTNFVVVVTEGNAHAGATYAVTIDGCKQVVVTSIAPNAGGTLGGTKVTISGAGFLPGATVTVGGSAATNVNVVDGNTITANTPVGVAGPADVTVTNADFATVSTDTSTLAGGFDYLTGADSIITIASNTNPSVFGQTVDFTTTVSSVLGIAPGTVHIFDGGSDISGPLTLDGTGSASFLIQTLAPGGHSITAHYDGSGAFLPGISAPLTQTVNLASTTTALQSSLNPSHIGQMVTFTAKVQVKAPGAGVPTGTVSFFDGVNDLADVALDATQTATFSTAALAIGDHMLTATYNGDGDYDKSTDGLTQTVSLFPATNVVTSSANPSVLNQNVTFTATLSGASGTPTGTADFFDGATHLAGPIALDGTGKAQFSTSTLVAGGHPITAVYSGDATYAGDTSPILNQTVGKAVATATTTSSLNPSKFGQSVILTCTVTGGATPTGTAQFFDDTTSLAAAGALDGTGKATLTTTTLAVGSHPITCHYSGDTLYASTVSAVLAQVVNQDGTTVTLASSQNPSNVGQSVTFTATVAAAVGTAIPTGTVAFKDGTATLGTFNVDATGKAALTTTALTAGTHSITAVYSGDTDNATSTSAALTQTVNALVDGGASDGGTTTTDGGTTSTDGGSSSGNDAGISGGGTTGNDGGQDASAEGGVTNGDLGGGGGCGCHTADDAAGMGGGFVTWLAVLGFLVASRRRRNGEKNKR